jgi:hypothetical protein
MSDGFTWTRHREHGGYWRCPDGALDDMAERGWEPCDTPPPQPDPAVAEQLAWRAEQAAAASKSPRAARRGGETE